MFIREPAVAGTFYPASEKELARIIDKFLSSGDKAAVRGMLVPHAGYIYSGKVAGLTYSRVRMPGLAIVIGPNHTGRGSAVSVMGKGLWKIPAKKVPVDEAAASRIIELSQYAEADTEAHEFEHSIEVQLPFIARLSPDVRIVPVCMGTHDVDAIEDMGEAIAHTLEETREPAVVIASSDMSHYIPEAEAETLDREAIVKMEKLDYRGLMETVRSKKITMCGAAAAAVMLKACGILKATKGELVHYNTSAEVSGDTSQVVGYAGMLVR